MSHPSPSQSLPRATHVAWPRRGAALLAALFAALVAVACAPNPEPLALTDVVRAAIARLETELGAPQPLPAPDDELARKVRARVAALAGDTSLLRGLGLSEVRDWGEGVVPTLNQLIGSPTTSGPERTTAIELLSVIDSPRAAAALASHVEENPSSGVRAQCAYHLGSTTQDQVVPRLVAVMAREKDEEVRRWVGGTLAHFGCHEFVTANDVVQRWRSGDLERALATPAPSPRFQLELWRRVATLAELPDGPERDATIDILGQMPPFAVDLLAQALLDRSERVRRGAARALARMGPRASPAAATLLRTLERDPPVELEAMLALGAARAAGARAAIERRLTQATSDSLTRRATAARALGSLRDPGSIPVLESACRESEPEVVRRAAALALLELGQERSALPVLCEVGAKMDDAEIDEALRGWISGREATGDSNATRAAFDWRALSTARERAAMMAGRWRSLVP